MKRPNLRLFLSALAIPLGLHAQNNLERKDGFIPLLWDESQGKLYFELSQFDRDILYFSEVAKGSGSGSVGLEWAAGGEGGGIIQFQRVGPRVLVVEKNLRFRAGAGGPGMEKGIDASFPDSILASLPIVKTDGDKVVVDATNLVIRDAAGFASGPRQAGEEVAVEGDAVEEAATAPLIPAPVGASIQRDPRSICLGPKRFPKTQK
jgi:hypothetical protein